MSNESQGLFKLQNESQKNSESLIFQWVTLLNLHYKADLSEPEQEIYLHGLREFDAKRLDEAFYRCRKECDFMPRVADVVKRMPEAEFMGTANADIGADFVPVRDWYEAENKTHNLHIWMDKHGRKKVQLVPISADQKTLNWPQHWPEKDCKPMSWDQGKERISQIGKSKSL